ncbi:MAG: hypothetical protein M3209_09380 [Acidobacteriota bacterium]|nr:hypothetical protein [Acidobacteriota bacterium]
MDESLEDLTGADLTKVELPLKTQIRFVERKLWELRKRIDAPHDDFETTDEEIAEVAMYANILESLREYEKSLRDQLGRI